MDWSSETAPNLCVLLDTANSEIPSRKLFRIVFLHMPHNLSLVRNDEIQSSVTKDDEELKLGIAIFYVGERALEGLLHPELIAVGAVVHGTEGTNRCSRKSNQL